MEDTVHSLTRRFILLKQAAAWHHHRVVTDSSAADAEAAAHAALKESLLVCQHKFSAFVDHFQPTVTTAGDGGVHGQDVPAARVSHPVAAKRQSPLPSQSRKRSREECFRETSHALSFSHQATSGQGVQHGAMFSANATQCADDSLRNADQTLLRTIGETEAFFVVLDTSAPCLPIARTSPACAQWTGMKREAPQAARRFALTAVTGHTAQSLQGQRLYILHGECANPTTLQLIQAACTPGRYAPLQCVLRTRSSSGNTVPANLFIAPMTTISGAVPMVVCVYRQTSEAALQEWEATSLPALAAALVASSAAPLPVEATYSEFLRFSERHATGPAMPPGQPAAAAPLPDSTGAGRQGGGGEGDPQARPFLQGRVSKFKLSAGRRGHAAVAAGSHDILWSSADGSAAGGGAPGSGTTMSLSTAASGSTFASQKQSPTPTPGHVPVTSTPLAGLGFVQHATGPTFAAQGFQVDTQHKPNIKSAQHKGTARTSAYAQKYMQPNANNGAEQPVAIGKVGSNFTVGFRERDCDGSVAGGGVGSQNIGAAPPVGPRSSASVALGPIGDGVLTADTQPEDSAFVTRRGDGQEAFAEDMALAPLLQDLYPEYAQPSKRSTVVAAAVAAFADLSDSEHSSG